MNDVLNRIEAVKDGSTTLAGYTYLGSGTVVRIDYTQPQVRLDLWGGTSGSFTGFDRFGRITNQKWVFYFNGNSRDEFNYGCDRDSNRVWKQNAMTTAKDEFYTYDYLNRLSTMQRGTLLSDKSGISGTAVREEDWTLDPTGNWGTYLTKTSGTTDLNQTRSHNKANETGTITSTPAWTSPIHDLTGNMTTIPRVSAPGTAQTTVYDAWNRLVELRQTTVIADYKYDGRGRRIFKSTDAESRDFYYSNAWQILEERVSGTADTQYVWGLRYVDELICRYWNQKGGHPTLFINRTRKGVIPPYL